MGSQTAAIHGHGYYDERGCFIVPIYQAAVFEQIVRETGELRKTDRGTDLKYSREENPTVRHLELALAKLEGGEDSLCFSSGMAAISTLFIGALKSGDEVVLSKEAYGTTIQLAQELSRFGVRTRLAYPRAEDIAGVVTRDTKLVFVETMTNPTLKVVDVRELAKHCRDLGVVLAVDNTFVTPVIYKPLADGARLVIHSLTKYLAGHNDVISGALIGWRELVMELWDWRRKLGCIASPFDAYLVLRGLKTLELRVRRHSESAVAVAEFLAEHPRVEEVLYPGLSDSEYHDLAMKLFRDGLCGGVVSFKVRGGFEEALEVLRRVRLIRPSPSLGGPESLMIVPVTSVAARMPPEVRKELGITENLLRLSVGLEDVEDIIEDLDRALQGART